MNGRKSIFYKYKFNRHKSVSDERFEIPKSAEYLLMFDVEDTVLKFIYELADKFECSGNCLISDIQKESAKTIKQIIKMIQENDGWRGDWEHGEENISSSYGRIGVLLQHLWI